MSGVLPREHVIKSVQMDLADYSSLSMLIPFTVCCVRFFQIRTTYAPFILLIFLGFISEILSTIVIAKGYSNIIINNIFILLQAYVIIWQFRNWQLFHSNMKLFPLVIILLSLFWLIENIILKFTNAVASYFLIFSSLIIALMSISIINKLLIKEYGSLLKNAIFLISLAWLLYFTYTILTEIFILYGLTEKSPFFANRVFDI